MALINCPECGHEISDSAKTCPNCGVTITVCPECGKLFAGEPEVCDNCGFRLKKTAGQEADGQIIPREYKVGSLQALWSSKMSPGKAVTKTLGLIDTVSVILGLILTVVIIVLYFVWRVKPVEAQIETIVSNYDTIKGLVIGACLTFGIWAVGTFSDDKIEHLVFARWLQDNKIDGKKFIQENYLDFTSPADMVAANMATDTLHSVYLNEKPNEKTMFIASCIAHLALCIVAYVCLGVAICENLQVVMAIEVLKIGYNIKYFKFVAAIICVVAFVAKKVLVWKIDGGFTERCGSWLKSIGNETASTGQ